MSFVANSRDIPEDQKARATYGHALYCRRVFYSPFNSARKNTPVVSRLALTLLIAACCFVAIAHDASASPSTPLTWATPCSADLDVATCERLTWIANALDESSTGLASVNTASDSTSRLDLIWEGIWAVAGLQLVIILAPSWHAAWKWFKA